MTRYIGPAVGAKGQVGFAEEGAWGKQVQDMTGFVEITGESVISDIGALISNSLRPDRAVHKRVGGVEACGGDVNAEIGPSGFETWFKHALGSVTTTRLDNAFILECTNPAETSCVLTITVVDGEATTFAVVQAVGANISIDLTAGAGDTIGEVMALINAEANLAAWSPYQATQGVWQTTIHASDYLTAAQNSNVLEETANIELIKCGGPGTRRWMVGTEWGCYNHVINAGSDLPEGMSVEIGRDVAAFLYAGMKVNTMELNATPGEFFLGTFGMMGKGGTTADTPAAATANTNHPKNAFKIRYTGTSATATLAIDSTNYTCTLELDGTTEDIVFNTNMPLVDPTTGTVYNVDKIGGLQDYLNDLSYVDCYLADYTDPTLASTSLNHYPATSITSTDYTWFNFNMGNIVSLPVLWGDYIGTDSGDSKKFYVQVVTGGVPGTATINFKIAGGAYGNTATTSATVPTEIRYNSNVDSGYTVFFPDNTTLIAGDIWEFETIRPASTASYSTVDPFSGYEGALTFDGAAEDIMGWSCTLNNNLYGDKYHLGERTRAKLPEQRRNVEGVVNLEFDDLDMYRRFINGTNGNLVMTFTSATYINTTALGNSATQYQLIVRQPNIEFNGTTPTIADEGIILTDFPYVSLYDDTNDVPDLRLTLVSDTPYI
ncbi:MAG TPA: phage tail tube protein [Patescibacteria group bacterium]|nr:phage tail tube protein [Patescibacteria group bacterium]